MADPGIDIAKHGADGIEYLYGEGRIDKKDVVRWCRLSAKLSGRVYTPGYVRGGRYGEQLKLRRREDLEDSALVVVCLFTKKAGYWRFRRDPKRSEGALGPAARKAQYEIVILNREDLDRYGVDLAHVEWRAQELTRERAERLAAAYRRNLSRRGDRRVVLVRPLASSRRDRTRRARRR